jgi:uncharacterized membrane protein HdeD (DUF308 family)
MGFRKSLAPFAAVALIASPISVQAAAREAAAAQSEQLAGHPWIPIAVIVAVLAAILLVVGDNDNPTSP